MTKEQVMKFIDEHLGDVVIVSYEEIGKDAKVVWKEYDHEEDCYFSIIGKSRYGTIIEKVGGEI
jgi:hypothetical protein